MQTRCTAYCIHGVDAFASLISLSLDPMAVEVREQSVDIVSTSSVAVPFLRVVPQECFVLETVRFLRRQPHVLVTRHNISVIQVLTSRSDFKCATKYLMRLLYKSDPIRFAPAGGRYQDIQQSLK
jgi:hypothetical protein